MTPRISPQPGIMEIALYQGGKSAIAGVDKPLKLSSNENPHGPSPAALAAFRAAAEGLALYPSTDHAGLRGAIGAVHGLDPDRVICGVGSDEIITFLCQAYAGPGDEVLYCEHGFLMYRISALAAGARPVKAPETARRADVDALLAACTPRTRLVFLANPNNPTGTMLGAAEVARLADGLPGHAILVLDGAYAEYVEGFDGGAALATDRPNVFMTRTLSKIYGLGGLRVGWGYGPREIVDVLNRVRGPFNLSAPALAAGEAAIRDQGWVARCRSENTRLRGEMHATLTRLGIACDASEGNFLLARMADGAEAEALDSFLQARGIIIRRVTPYGFPEGLRITIGTEAECARVAEALQAFRLETVG